MTRGFHRSLGVCIVSAIALLAPSMSQASDGGFTLVSTIAFASTRDNPSVRPPLRAAEIYLISPDGTNPRRLTDNTEGDAFAALSPDGKKIVFDSARERVTGEPINTSDLFLMKADGTDPRLLTRGSSATWAPDGKHIAFHASASGTGLPSRTDPGAATLDSDIFVTHVYDLLDGVSQPWNITNSPTDIDDDPDWSPDGQLVLFTKHPVTDDPRLSNLAEIYTLKANGAAAPERLTFNAEEERGPTWSPDGGRIAYACRIGGGSFDFEICVMDADGSNQLQLTDNTVPDLTPTWSPDGDRLVFHKPVGVGAQLFVMDADGTDVTQITFAAGQNVLANWGELRVKVDD